MHQWAALAFREYRKIKPLVKLLVLLGQDNTTTWTTQGFMCGEVVTWATFTGLG